MPSSNHYPSSSDSSAHYGGDGMEEGIDWEVALEVHRADIRRVLASKLSGRGESSVNDVMQEFELAVSQSKNRPTNPGKVSAWLYQVAHRKVQDYWRKTQRQLRLVADIPEAEQVDWTSPFDWVLRVERVQEVQEAIACLTSADRNILQLKYVEGMSYSEIAKQEKLSVKAVEYRLLRARDELRKYLVR